MYHGWSSYRCSLQSRFPLIPNQDSKYDWQCWVTENRLEQETEADFTCSIRNMIRLSGRIGIAMVDEVVEDIAIGMMIGPELDTTWRNSMLVITMMTKSQDLSEPPSRTV